MKTRGTKNLYGAFPLPVHPKITYVEKPLHGAIVSLGALAILAALFSLVSLVH